jgi:ATP-dependent Clp protease adaptor protein ClpS
MSHHPEEQYDSSEGGAAVLEGRPRLKEPPQYAVLLHNDDYTTMEFVVEVLQKFFRKTGEQAMQIMLQVHQQGSGVAGVYHLEIAETKVSQVHDYAQSHGYPLKCSLEPANS